MCIENCVCMSMQLQHVAECAISEPQDGEEGVHMSVIWPVARSRVVMSGDEASVLTQYLCQSMSSSCVSRLLLK